MLNTLSNDLRRYTQSKHPWRMAAALLLSYLIVYELSLHYLPTSAALHPATALALCALFFGGMRLWPLVYVTALGASLLAGMPALSIILGPISVTLQAATGTYLLNKTRVDPLFRRYRDTFYLIAIASAISFISPAFEALSYVLHGTPYTIATWSISYVGAIFCFLIILPLALRWLTKPRFSRTPLEMAEISVVFVALIGIDYELFIRGVQTFIGIPLVYLLLIPLFIIALRLRPRFVTLALFLTSLFAIESALVTVAPEMLVAHLFAIESFIITLSIIFSIIVSSEEDRRVATNLFRSQLGTLENAMARINSESNAKNNFIAILAHELRNPLAPIVSGIEVLQLKGVGDADDRETLAVMADRITTVRRLLDDLLDISRIAEGKITLKHETVSLQRTIERAIFSTHHHRKELHQSLVTKIPEATLSIAGDPVRLEQVFSNLLTNASKYSNSGDTVTLIVRQQDRIVEIEVSDEGVGIPRDALETIFQPFRQIEQGKRTEKGLGIGLALVRNLVELHRGSVAASSEGPGRGSRFLVRLPLLFSATYANDAETDSYATEIPARAEKGENGLSILVVDDNDAAAGSMGRLLELKGSSVIYAYTGAQAIEKALSLSPDVVLLDVGLPDRDGYEVAKVLRSRGFTGRLIALTGYGSADNRALGSEAGFDHYLVKPAGLADLRRVLPELG
jgi:signal transduction histidine kinase